MTDVQIPFQPAHRKGMNGKFVSKNSLEIRGGSVANSNSSSNNSSSNATTTTNAIGGGGGGTSQATSNSAASASNHLTNNSTPSTANPAVSSATPSATRHSGSATGGKKSLKIIDRSQSNLSNIQVYPIKLNSTSSEKFDSSFGTIVSVKYIYDLTSNSAIIKSRASARPTRPAAMATTSANAAVAAAAAAAFTSSSMIAGATPSQAHNTNSMMSNTNTSNVRGATTAASNYNMGAYTGSYTNFNINASQQNRINNTNNAYNNITYSNSNNNNNAATITSRSSSNHHAHSHHATHPHHHHSSSNHHGWNDDSNSGWTGTGVMSDRSSVYSIDDGDFDKEASRKVNSQLREIESILYERNSSHSSNLIEYTEWLEKFPHIRILGKQVHNPYREDASDMSRPSLGVNLSTISPSSTSSSAAPTYRKISISNFNGLSTSSSFVSGVQYLTTDNSSSMSNITSNNNNYNNSSSISISNDSSLVAAAEAKFRRRENSISHQNMQTLYISGTRLRVKTVDEEMMMTTRRTTKHRRRRPTTQIPDAIGIDNNNNNEDDDDNDDDDDDGSLVAGGVDDDETRRVTPSGEFAFLEEEIFAEDGTYEELLAYDNQEEEHMFKHNKRLNLNKRRRHGGLPPITPKASVKDLIANSLFDHVWSEVIDWSANTIITYARTLTAAATAATTTTATASVVAVLPPNDQPVAANRSTVAPILVAPAASAVDSTCYTPDLLMHVVGAEKTTSSSSLSFLADSHKKMTSSLSSNFNNNNNSQHQQQQQPHVTLSQVRRNHTSNNMGNQYKFDDAATVSSNVTINTTYAIASAMHAASYSSHNFNFNNNNGQTNGGTMPIKTPNIIQLKPFDQISNVNNNNNNDRQQSMTPGPLSRDNSSLLTKLMQNTGEFDGRNTIQTNEALLDAPTGASGATSSGNSVPGGFDEILQIKQLNRAGTGVANLNAKGAYSNLVPIMLNSRVGSASRRQYQMTSSSKKRFSSTDITTANATSAAAPGSLLTSNVGNQTIAETTSNTNNNNNNNKSHIAIQGASLMIKPSSLNQFAGSGVDQLEKTTVHSASSSASATNHHHHQQQQQHHHASSNYPQSASGVNANTFLPLSANNANNTTTTNNNNSGNNGISTIFNRSTNSSSQAYHHPVEELNNYENDFDYTNGPSRHHHQQHQHPHHSHHHHHHLNSNQENQENTIDEISPISFSTNNLSSINNAGSTSSTVAPMSNAGGSGIGIGGGGGSGGSLRIYHGTGGVSYYGYHHYGHQTLHQLPPIENSLTLKPMRISSANNSKQVKEKNQRPMTSVINRRSATPSGLASSSAMARSQSNLFKNNMKITGIRLPSADDSIYSNNFLGSKSFATANNNNNTNTNMSNNHNSVNVNQANLTSSNRRNSIRDAQRPIKIHK